MSTMNTEQWALVLAPGITPASEEALEHFTGRRSEHYEIAITEVLTNWPVLGEDPAPAMLETPQETPEELAITNEEILERLMNLLPDPVTPPDEECPF